MALEAVHPGHMIRCRVGEADVLLCRPTLEVIYALQNRCSHMAKPLDGGRLIGYRISCPEHGAEFDIRSGEALSFPAVRPVKTYPVDIRQNMVFVAID